MLENKITSFVKKYTAVLLLTVALAATGCGFGLSESGSESVASLNQGDYLDLGVLDRNDVEVNEKVYETYTLEYGTFTVTQSIGASLFEPITYQEKARYDSGSMVFNEFLVKEMDYVKKGDAIASVSMETDSISIKEAELSLSRLKTQYEEALKSREEAVADREEVLDKLKTDEEKTIRLLQWQIADLNWQKTEASYKDRIKTSEDNISEMKKNAKTKTINAEHSGYVYYIEKLEAGALLKNGQNIMILVPTDMVYLEINDRDMNIGFNQTYKVNARVGRSGYEFEAYTINPPLRSLYFNMNTGKAYLVVNAKMTNTMYKSTIAVSGVAYSIDNVLLVPVDAVVKENDTYYVTVLGEDESIAKLPFISGGINKDYHWVISGLEAGTKVIHD